MCARFFTRNFAQSVRLPYFSERNDPFMISPFSSQLLSGTLRPLLTTIEKIHPCGGSIKYAQAEGVSAKDSE